MERRTFISGIILGLLAAPLIAEAQQAGKVYRIGHLSSGSPPGFVEEFRQGLRERGYLEGQNIAVEYRWAEGNYDRLPGLVAELLRLKIDVIVTDGTPATQAAKQATRTVPIVMVAIADPLVAGLVASLARPGGNITGLTFLSAEVAGKRLELLREIVPGLTRVAILSNPAHPGSAPQVKETEEAARALRVDLLHLEARDPKEFDGAFTAMVKWGAGALMVLSDVMFRVEAIRIVDLAARHRLPTTYPWPEPPKVGGLMAYGASIPDQVRRVAVFVDKILKGTKPADLPVEQPTKFELVINLKTAKALGLTIPQSVLYRADKVIK